MSLELKEYIKDALSRGASRDTIAQTLNGAGWSKSVVHKTLDQFSGVDANGIPIPAPRMQAHQIARDLFIYLLILVTLTLSACALGGLLFNLIERTIPDASITNYSNGNSGINWAIAQLVVTFPAFSILTRLVQKDISQHPEKRESLIRKLLIYFIMALTAVVGLSDLIGTLSAYLGGELSLRFLSKAGVILGISLLIFIYYLYEMRRDDSVVRG